MMTKTAERETYLRQCIRALLTAEPTLSLDSGELLSGFDGSNYASTKRHLQSIAQSIGATLPFEPVSAGYPISSPAFPKQIGYIKSLTRQIERLGGDVPLNDSLTSSEASRVIKRLLAQKSRLGRVVATSA